MKKLLFLLLVILSSCDRPVSKATSRSLEKEFVPFRDVVHFEYRNHQYIKFDECSGSCNIGGVVHDPDCKYCKQ